MSRIIPIVFSVLLILSCASVPHALETSASVPDIEAVSVEFYGLTAGEGLSAASSGQVEAVSAYLSDRLTNSPYYRIVLTDQERVLTGKINRIAEKYQLSLSMVNYTTTEVESVVTETFLSLNEFDFVVDLAVSRLEGRDIGIDIQAEGPVFTLDSFPEVLLPELLIPQIAAAEEDENLKRITGMLWDELAEGDYKLEAGEYKAAEAVYMNFLDRYDEGISSEYKEQLSDIRSYAGEKAKQAEALGYHQQAYSDLAGILEEYGISEDAEDAFARLTSLRTDTINACRPFLDAEGAYPFLEEALSEMGSARASVFTSLLARETGGVRELLERGDSFAAWEKLANLKQIFQRDDLSVLLPLHYEGLAASLKEVRAVCDGIVSAKKKEFFFNTSYYGFKDDTPALNLVFREYRTFLAGIPFESRRLMTGFNRQISEYAVAIDPIPLNLDDFYSVLKLMNVFGYDIFENSRNLEFVRNNPFPFPMKKNEFLGYLEFVKENLDYSGHFYSSLDKNEKVFLDELNQTLDTSVLDADRMNLLARRIGRPRADDIIYALEFERLNFIEFLETTIERVSSDFLISDFEDVDRLLEDAEWARRKYRHRDNRNSHHSFYNWHKDWLSLNSRFFDFFVESEFEDEYGLPFIFGSRSSRDYIGEADYIPFTFIALGPDGVELISVPSSQKGYGWSPYYDDGNNTIVIFSGWEEGRKHGAVFLSLEDMNLDFLKRLSRAEWNELIEADMERLY